MPDPPSHIGTYRVIRVLGEGGMGTVYEAMHDGIKRRVAIKILHPEYARKPELVQRFLNEARAVNIVTHPGLVQISECGQGSDGTAYLVMEYLDGDTLSARLRKHGGRLAEAKVVLYMSQLAAALSAAHASGIVHRDLKPGNVMLIHDPMVPSGERVKLLDFGIAKLGQQGGSTDAVHTRTGVTMGTPRYMAPEQCLGASQVDAKADVYSLGIMMFEMLAGEPPFVSEIDLAILNMHISKAPPSLQKSAPAVSTLIAKLVNRMLSKTPADRPTMAEVSQVLRTQAAARPHEPEPVFEPDNAGETRLLPTNVPTFRKSDEKLPGLPKRRRLAAVGVALGVSIIAGIAIWEGSRAKGIGPHGPQNGPIAVAPISRQEVVIDHKSPSTMKSATVVSVLSSQPAGAKVVRQPDRNEILVAEPATRKPRPVSRPVASINAKHEHAPATHSTRSETPETPKVTTHAPANRIID